MQDTTSPIGEILYPSLVTPGMDLSANECWQCGLRVNESEAAELMRHCDDLLNEYRANNPSFPQGSTWKNRQGRDEYLNFPYKPARRRISEDQYEPIDGKVDLSFKRKTKTRKGDQNTPPVILSSRGVIVKNPPEITYGSVGRVIFSAFVYDNQSKGVAFFLKGVQIAKLAAAAIEAGAIDGGWDPEAEAAPTSQAVFAPMPLGDDDDMPF